MKKVFVKMKNDTYELVDKSTGEVTELTQTFVVEEEDWFKLYVGVFASAIDKLTGNAIKFFGICLKHSRPDQGEGNYFVISDHYLQEDLSKKSLFANRSKYIKELLDNSFIYKIRRCQYGINPQIAYCGDRHSRAKLILKIIHEPTDKILSDTKE